LTLIASAALSRTRRFNSGTWVSRTA
jgi:hypothetical protein